VRWRGILLEDSGDQCFPAGKATAEIRITDPGFCAKTFDVEKRGVVAAHLDASRRDQRRAGDRLILVPNHNTRTYKPGETLEGGHYQRS
jgi:hypothetical protein